MGPDCIRYFGPRVVARRTLLLALVVGLVAAAPAPAQVRLLMPGVTYEKQVLFTNHGPVVLHVLTAPKPGGLYSLKPVLSNGLIPGTQTVTSMQADVSKLGTVAGVNGDLFNFQSGQPTGVLLRDGVLEHRPSAERSSIALDVGGNLRVERATMFGTWQGSGQRRTVSVLNENPTANAVSLYTPVWGAATPPSTASFEVALDSFPPAIPNNEITGTVAYTNGGGNTAIPPGGAVLVARGSQVAKLRAEAAIGQLVKIRLVLQPEWRDIVQAVGGGPLVVRDGKPVFRANEVFTDVQLLPRAPRTAVGQRADGKVVLVTVDGRQPGYSVGVTNFELAQAMARLGCVTASGLDSGGSTTMAFDGQLLNTPSDGVERPVANGLFVFYSGVWVPSIETPVISPNGDGVGDRETLAYKVVRPSMVTAKLIAPSGAVRFTETVSREPGTYTVPWTGKTPAGAPEAQGRWQWLVSAVDDESKPSSAYRYFWVNNTLGFLRAERVALAVPRAKPRRIATVSLGSAAKLTVTIETESGAPLATILNASQKAGQLEIVWDGLNRNKRPVFTGRYVVRVSARNSFGTSELTATFPVRRIALQPRAPARTRG
jgi:hypothetical protein